MSVRGAVRERAPHLDVVQDDQRSERELPKEVQ